MKKFDIELAKQGKPVCTKCGYKARIICYDCKSNYPIVALVYDEEEKKEMICNYHLNGEIGVQEEELDLMMDSEKHEGWVNIHREGSYFYVCSDIFRNEETAKDDAKNLEDYVATVKIEWEE